MPQQDDIIFVGRVTLPVSETNAYLDADLVFKGRIHGYVRHRSTDGFTGVAITPDHAPPWQLVVRKPGYEPLTVDIPTNTPPDEIIWIGEYVLKPYTAAVQRAIVGGDDEEAYIAAATARGLPFPVVDHTGTPCSPDVIPDGWEEWNPYGGIGWLSAKREEGMTCSIVGARLVPPPGQSGSAVQLRGASWHGGVNLSEREEFPALSLFNFNEPVRLRARMIGCKEIVLNVPTSGTENRIIWLGSHNLLPYLPEHRTSLTGIIRDENGMPLTATGTVYYGLSSHRIESSLQDGQFRFETVFPNSYSVGCSIPGWYVDRKRIQVTEELLPVELELTAYPRMTLALEPYWGAALNTNRVTLGLLSKAARVTVGGRKGMRLCQNGKHRLVMSFYDSLLDSRVKLIRTGLSDKDIQNDDFCDTYGPWGSSWRGDNPSPGDTIAIVDADSKPLSMVRITKVSYGQEK